MKRKMKFVLLGIAAAVAAVTAAYAAGDENDPLVTLSYLKNVFTAQVQALVDQTVSESDAQIKGELDQAIADWDGKVREAMDAMEPAGSEQGSALFKAVSFAQSQSLKCAAGTELVVRSGSAVADTDLLDQTDGVTLSRGQTLKAGHLYLAVSACIITVPESQLTGAVNAGPLNLREGPGSSYKILGTLASGTAVTVLSTNGSWYHVKAGSLTGYVSAVYVTLNAAAPAGSVSAMVRGGGTVS